MYRAALASGVHRPAWGALTGVRPGKIFCSLLAAGLSEDEATRRFIDEYDVTPKRAALCRDTSRETVKAVSELGEKDVCLTSASLSARRAVHIAASSVSRSRRA